jgi:hypothetical protein
MSLIFSITSKIALMFLLVELMIGENVLLHFLSTLVFPGTGVEALLYGILMKIVSAWLKIF